jgi:hypothetical protein
VRSLQATNHQKQLWDRAEAGAGNATDIGRLEHIIVKDVGSVGSRWIIIAHGLGIA